MADLAQHYRVTRAIGAAMIASLLVYWSTPWSSR